MENLCILCGANKEQAPCEHNFKKMCLNCFYNVDGCCSNNENAEAMIRKLTETVGTSYKIEHIELKPLPLKNPEKKCGKWSANTDRILTEVLSHFE